MKIILFVDNSTRCFCIFRLPIAKAFIAKGYKVYVMSPPPYDYYLNRITEIGAEHIAYEISGDFSPIGDLKLFAMFYRTYKNLKPNFIIHYTIKPNIYGTLAAKLCSIPSLSVVPGTGSTFQKKNLISRIVLLLYQLAFLFPQRIWVLNEDDYNAFLNKKIVNKHRIEILPGEGVDITYFKSHVAYYKHTPFIFLYMGRMLREKGVEFIAKASRLLKDRGVTGFEVHLLGLTDGLSKDIISIEEIKEWEEEGLVRFLGSISDVRNSIANSDCILLPTFYGEGVPRSLMEACAMERAVLASNNVGCRDIISDMHNGVLCQARNVKNLADKMEYMISLSENELKKMGINGRIKVEKIFREEIIVERYLQEVIIM